MCVQPSAPNTDSSDLSSARRPQFDEPTTRVKMLPGIPQTIRRPALVPTLPRLLIVSDTLPPDPNGIALIAVRTAEILARRATVHLVGPNGSSAPPGVCYTGAARLPVGTPDVHIPRPLLRSMSNAVSAADRVVIHTLGPLGCAALYYARRQRKHVTLFMHNDYPALLRYGLPRTAAAPVVNWLAQRVERWAQERASRIVVPLDARSNGYEVLRLDPPRYTGWASPGLDNSRLTVAYHGRVSREKSVDITVRAIHAADPDHTRLRFRIIGDGSQLWTTLRLAEVLGVPVEHVPWCTDPRPALCGAQIYVTASRIETFSMTTLEALGCGLPLIARGVGQISNYVQHGVNGLLFQSDDQLAGLLAGLAGDRDARLRLSSAARGRAVDDSLWEQFADASWRTCR